MKTTMRKTRPMTRPWNDQALIQQMNSIKSLLAGVPVDVKGLGNQCLVLSKIIDSLVANNMKPIWRLELLPLVKQICKYKESPDARVALMVLLLSVKSAFRTDWLPVLQVSAEDEIFTTLKLLFESLTTNNEVGGQAPMQHLQCGGSAANNTLEAGQFLSHVSHRFYPRLKLNAVFVAMEAKAGYEVLMCDFHVPHMNILDRVRLYVSQKDTTDTAACLITPSHVNFLVNGKQVEKRVTVGYLDGGPQMPTDVTRLVKVGANVLQVIGEFSECRYKNHIYKLLEPHVIAVGSARSIELSAKNTQLKDYIPPTRSANELDSSEVDDEVVEGASRVSLRCPVSHQRLVTAVKATTCRHLQCFDCDSFLEINERRPAWRCPCCNRHISWIDLRIDRQMEKVLKEADEKVVEVIISQDGSWVPVFTGEDNGISGTDASAEGGLLENDVIDLSSADIAEKESNGDRQNSRDSNLPDRKPDKQTLQAVIGNRVLTPQTTNLSTGNRETAGGDRIERSEQAEPSNIPVSNLPDITASEPQNSVGTTGPSWSRPGRNEGVFFTLNEGVPGARTVTIERQVHSQPAPPAAVVQALPAPLFSQVSYGHSRTSFHMNNPGGSVNSVASGGGYTSSVQPQQPHTGSLSDATLVYQDVDGGGNVWQRRVVQQASGISQDGQDVSQGRQQWQGSLVGVVTNTAQSQSVEHLGQQFIVNQGVPYSHHQAPYGANSQQMPVPMARGSTAGWPSSSAIPAQAFGVGTTTEQNWRPTGRMRGSIAPTAMERSVGQPSPHVQMRTSVNGFPANVHVFNTSTNVSPPIVVSGPNGAQYAIRNTLQGNTASNDAFFNASSWVNDPDLSTQPILFQGVNTSEGWMNFETFPSGNSQPN